MTKDDVHLPGESDSLDFAQEDSPPQDWEVLLSADPHADYFHTTHWTCCARDHHPELTAFWLTARWQGRLVGGLAGLKKSKLVSRWESNLEGTSGGPLVDASLPENIAIRIFNSLVEKYLQLRGAALGSTCLTLNHCQENHFGNLLKTSVVDWQREDISAAVIPLDGGLEFVEMNRMNNNKRNERNRGLRRNAQIIITNDPSLLAAYYPIYEKASERWNLPPAPLPFLQALLGDANTVPSGATRTFFTCIMLDGEVIGGHLNLQYRDRVIAWNGVTAPEFSRTHFPATLSIWGDIQESCRRGALSLDLGGSGGVVSLDGFKKYFGALSEIRGHYVLDSAGMKILRGGKKLLQGLRSSTSSGPPRRWHDGTTDGKTNS